MGYGDDMNWAYKHFNELKMKYSHRYVAIVDKEVVASGIKINNVRNEAKKKTGKSIVAIILADPTRRYEYRG